MMLTKEQVKKWELKKLTTKENQERLVNHWKGEGARLFYFILFTVGPC